MKHSLSTIVADFLTTHNNPNRPLLLALSGGPDSLALLHLLLEYQKNVSALHFGVAHVDHGWRKESAQEAKILENMVSKMGLPFHLKTLDFSSLKGNLEAVGREERLKFFKDLCNQCGYKAVLFGHHADDLAETVLKRTLEGAALPHLRGMREVSNLFGITVWRPLLTVNKSQLIEWLEERGLSGFKDSTNEDPRFLRGRFRSNILPFLSKEFGKEICPALCRLSTEATELRDYLDQKIAPYLAQTIKGPFGSLLDLRACFPIPSFEIKHLIRCFCEMHDFALSRESLEKAALLFDEGTANKKIEGGKHSLYIDRKCLFVFNKPVIITDPFESYSLTEKGVKYGNWNIRIDHNPSDINLFPLDWKGLWKGVGCIQLPKNHYLVSKPDLKLKYQDKIPLDKWWTDHKVPAFLRLWLPVINNEKGVCHEFLTGKSSNSVPNKDGLMTTIRLQAS